jgi:hypothetical protein
VGPQGRSHPDQRGSEHPQRHQLKLTKQEIQDLPPVDIDHPGLSAAVRLGNA